MESPGPTLKTRAAPTSREKMEKRISVFTDRNRKYKARNEDSGYSGVIKNRSGVTISITAVADGVSSVQYGAEASRKAIEVLVDGIKSGSEVNARELEGKIRPILDSINRDLLDFGRGQAGTTLSAAIGIGPEILIAHIGDSRVYYVDCRRCICLTDDHTPLAYAQKRGASAEDLAQINPHAIDKCLGVAPLIEPDVNILYTEKMAPNGGLFVTSDGVHGFMSNEEFLLAWRATDGVVEDFAQYCVEGAIKGTSDGGEGNRDNATLAVMRVPKASKGLERIFRATAVLALIGMVVGAGWFFFLKEDPDSGSPKVTDTIKENRLPAERSQKGEQPLSPNEEASRKSEPKAPAQKTPAQGGDMKGSGLPESRVALKDSRESDQPQGALPSVRVEETKKQPDPSSKPGKKVDNVRSVPPDKEKLYQSEEVNKELLELKKEVSGRASGEMSEPANSPGKPQNEPKTATVSNIELIGNEPDHAQISITVGSGEAVDNIDLSEVDYTHKGNLFKSIWFNGMQPTSKLIRVDERLKGSGLLMGYKLGYHPRTQSQPNV